MNTMRYLSSAETVKPAVIHCSLASMMSAGAF